LLNRFDDLIAQELSEIFDPESSPSPNVKREEQLPFPATFEDFQEAFYTP
jgi:hypothetical protein